MATTASTTATIKKSVSETGHNKNVANFSKALTILEEMGDLYNPSNAALKLTALNPIATELSDAIEILNTKTPIYKNEVAARNVAIAPLGKLTTRTLNFAKSVKISENDKQNLQSKAEKIRGDAKPKAVNPDIAEGKAISTSQMSYDNRIANLDAYIKQLASHPLYAPNQTDLTIISLKAYHDSLKALNTKVSKSGTALITARTNRNDHLYKNAQNVIETIEAIKFYLKSLGTEGEHYYKALVKLKFKDLPKEN